MRDYSVPIITHLVELDYAGQTLSGRVFLPTVSEHHEGEVRLDEWINAPRRFFPFLPEGERETVLLNKAWVTCLAVEAEAAGDPPADPAALQVDVVVEHAGRRTEGRVHVDSPPPRQRLVDHLNLPEAFLALRRAEALLLIRKRDITRIQEAEKEE